MTLLGSVRMMPASSMATSGVDQPVCKFIIIFVSMPANFESAASDAPSKLTGFMDYSAVLASIDATSATTSTSSSLRRFGLIATSIYDA